MTVDQTVHSSDCRPQFPPGAPSFLNGIHITIGVTSFRCLSKALSIVEQIQANVLSASGDVSFIPLGNSFGHIATYRSFRAAGSADCNDSILSFKFAVPIRISAARAAADRTSGHPEIIVRCCHLPDPLSAHGTEHICSRFRSPDELLSAIWHRSRRAF